MAFGWRWNARPTTRGLGSGLASRALAAVHGLDQLLSLSTDQLSVVPLVPPELDLAVRLQSRDPADREWRRSLGARGRRLDAGEAASIAIASRRSWPFASDDEDALALWTTLTRSAGWRTRDLLKLLADRGAVTENEAHAVYEQLQSDDLHRLGGPPW